MKAIALAAGLTLLFFAVAVEAQTLTEPQKAEIEKAAKNQITALYNAFDSLNADAAIQLWSRDKILGTLTATGLNSDPESILKGMKSTFANRTAQKSEISEIKVLVPSPEMAIGFAKGTYRIEYKNGNISVGDWASTTILAKEAGGWKIVHFAQTSATRQ